MAESKPRKSVGRPFAPANERRDYQLNIRLNEAEMTWLRAKAHRHSLSLTTAARLLMTAQRPANR